jgi:hypothetical protein
MRNLAALLAAMLLAATWLPSSAQEANPEPGYCAQFYPNADCNTGPDAPNATVRRPPRVPAAPKRKPRAQSATAPLK